MVRVNDRRRTTLRKALIVPCLKDEGLGVVFGSLRPNSRYGERHFALCDQMGTCLALNCVCDENLVFFMDETAIGFTAEEAWV